MPGKSRKQRLEEMLAENPDDPFLRYGVAMEHLGAGEDEQGCNLLQDIIARTPSYVPAYVQAGKALVRLQRLEEARGVYQRGIEVARGQGDEHAASEMALFLEHLGEGP